MAIQGKQAVRDYSYYKRIFSGVPMPFAFVELDALDANVRQVLQRSGAKLIRIASKSIRSVAVLRLLQKHDSRFRGLLSYTAREALYLSECGFDDLVVAYPAWDPKNIKEVAVSAREGRPITLMIDSLEHVDHIESVSAGQEACVPLCIDIDMASDYPGLHFGVWRSMVRTSDRILGLADRIAASKHVRLDGVMGYEAQIAGLGDRIPGQRLKSGLVRWLKNRSIREVANRRAELIQALTSAGHLLRFVNGGGTGSIDSTCSEDVVTEVTVGSGFYAPALFDGYRDFRYQPAAGFAIQIVRQPRSDLYTCLGGGYIASGVADPNRLPKPWLPEGAALLPLEGAGEVQTPVRYDGSEKLSLGDPIFMRHSKAGELCEHFNELYFVSNGQIVDRVTTYRGDGKCFL